MKPSKANLECADVIMERNNVPPRLWSNLRRDIALTLDIAERDAARKTTESSEHPSQHEGTILNVIHGIEVECYDQTAAKPARVVIRDGGRESAHVMACARNGRVSFQQLPSVTIQEQERSEIDGT